MPSAKAQKAQTTWKCCKNRSFWLNRTENLEFSGILGNKTQKIFSESLVRNRNSPDIFTVTFYERHLWAGLLGWPG
jgi:hypothetical protein